MDNLNITYLWRLFMKRLVIIVITACICAVLIFAYCNWIVTPIYSARAQIMIDNGAIIKDEDIAEALTSDSDGQSSHSTESTASKITANDVNTSIYIASSVCMGLLKTNEPYELLVKKLGGDYTASQLQSKISVSLSDDSDMFINVTVNDADPQQAIIIADAFGEAATSFLEDTLSYVKARVTAKARSTGLVSPHTLRDTFVAFLGGAVVCFAIVVLIDMNDTAIRGEHDFTSHYKTIPVLGNVPDFEKITNKGGYYGYGRK